MQPDKQYPFKQVIHLSGTFGLTVAMLLLFAFSALTLLVGCQEEHLACKY